jgi:hypothetical protein
MLDTKHAIREKSLRKKKRSTVDGPKDLTESSPRGLVKLS